MKQWICREISTSTSDNENGVLMREKELIRCKDCKYWQFYDLVKANVCKRRYNGHWWTSHEDDFCSRAEREENEQTTD